MARVFAPEDQEDDFLQHLLKSRVQRNPQLQRQKIQLVGGAPEEPAPPAPKPQPLTGLIRSEKAMPRPSSGPPVPSLTPSAPTGSGDARAAAINRVAQQIGANPLDLATVISYESAGKFSPSIYGGKGGRHLGLIQFGPAEQRKYGVHANQTFDEQMNAVGAYLKDRGFKPGMSREQLYSTINAGRPDRLGARDAAAGGAPGTVLDKVRTQMAGHEAKARKLLGNTSDTALSSPPAAAPLAVTAPGPRADAQPSSRDGRVQVASNDPSFVPAATQAAVARAADTGAAPAPPARAADTGAAPAPLPPSRPPASAFRTEQAGAAPGPMASLFKGLEGVTLRAPDPNTPPPPPDTISSFESLFKGLEGAKLAAGEGFSYEPPGGQRSDAPLPPPRPQAFRTEQIGGSQGNDQLVGSAGPLLERTPNTRPAFTGSPPSLLEGPNTRPAFTGQPSSLLEQTAPPTPFTVKDLSKLARYSGGRMDQVGGLVLHHTGGGGTPEDVINTLNQRGLGVQYVMDRDGQVYRTLPQGARGAHIRPSERGEIPISNKNALGLEVIAKDDTDITPAQKAAIGGFRDYAAKTYGFDPNNVYGHGAINSHKQPTEGAALLAALGGGGNKVLPPEAGGPALGQPMPEPRVTEMPPAASAAPEANVTTPMSEAELAAGAGGGDTGLGGLLGGLAKGLGGGSSGGNLNAERTMSPGMGQGYDEKLGAASKAALGAQPLFGNVGDLAKTRQLSKMFDLQDLGQIGQPQLARRKLGFGL